MDDNPRKEEPLAAGKPPPPRGPRLHRSRHSLRTCDDTAHLVKASYIFWKYIISYPKYYGRCPSNTTEKPLPPHTTCCFSLPAGCTRVRPQSTYGIIRWLALLAGSRQALTHTTSLMITSSRRFLSRPFSFSAEAPPPHPRCSAGASSDNQGFKLKASFSSLG